MVATFLIEIIGALYVLLRYRANVAARLSIGLLVCLGFFQLAEYMVCEGAFGISSLDWARFGYVAITMLPPLGIHLGLTIAKRRNRVLLVAAYGSAVVFSVCFLLVEQGMQSQLCLGNYVLFKIAGALTIPYFIYYYGWLLVGLGLAVKYARRMQKHEARDALYGLAAGYAAFIAPTTVVNLIEPRTISGIPSIMCGFAVLFALTLLFWIAPRSLEPRK